MTPDREATRRALRDHPEWSNARIAAAGAAPNREFVGRVRSQMEAEAELPRLDVAVGRDGRTWRVARRTCRKQTLICRLNVLRALVRGLDDGIWRAAEPRTRRLFWQNADRLADEVTRRIDILTGELIR